MPSLIAAFLMILLAFALTFVVAEWASTHWLRHRELVFQEKALLSGSKDKRPTGASVADPPV